MTDVKEDYQTASGFSGFVSFIGWVAIVASVIIPLILLEEAGRFGLLSIPIAFVGGLVGLILVVSGQSLKAQLDTANYTKKLLEIAKKKQ